MAISVKNLSFRYERKAIIKDVSFSLEKGKFISLIGPNGSGKSTLLKTMLYLQQPQKGETRIEDNILKEMKPKERAKLVGFLPQSPEIHEQITVEELVKLGRYHNKKAMKPLQKEDFKAVNEAIEWIGLSDFRNTSILSLSGGQKQRAFLAMVLAQQTDYIFLDEPTSYLDINHQIEFVELLKRLQTELGKTIVIVLHDLPIVAKYSDYVITLKNGELYSSGTPCEVFNTAMLNNVFSVQADINAIADTYQVLCSNFRRPDCNICSMENKN